jgi:hypothetical protein
MKKLIIEVRKGQTEPETITTIPFGAIRLISQIVPKEPAAILEEEGLNLEEIIMLAEKEGVTGMLVEIKKLKKTMTIAIEKLSETHRKA